jgi:hypothetical protein
MLFNWYPFFVVATDTQINDPFVRTVQYGVIKAQAWPIGLEFMVTES